MTPVPCRAKVGAVTLTAMLAGVAAWWTRRRRGEAGQSAMVAAGGLAGTASCWEVECKALQVVRVAVEC